MKKRLKINGIIIMALLVIIAAFPHLFLRNISGGLGEDILEILGITCILLGQLIRMSARGYKSLCSQQGSALVQSGPYAVVRNPMYVGIFLTGLGIVFVVCNWWMITLFIVLFTVRYVLLIFNEEKKLKALFPREYPEYQKRVPRLLPGFKTLQMDVREYLPLQLSWIGKEIGPLIVIFTIVLLVESWEEIVEKGWRGYANEVVVFVFVVLLFMAFVFYLAKVNNGVDKGSNIQ